MTFNSMKFSIILLIGACYLKNRRFLLYCLSISQLLGKDPVNHVLMKSIFERIMEQSMILLHFNRTPKAFLLSKWNIGIDKQASHIWEEKNTDKDKIWKFGSWNNCELKHLIKIKLLKLVEFKVAYCFPRLYFVYTR